MNGEHLAILALVLGATCLLAAGLARRQGKEKRDVRLMMAGGGAFGGLALVLHSLAGT